MPIPQALVTRYFQLIFARQFTESERELERLKHRMQKTEWNRGYFRALYGLDFSDKAVLHGYRKEFLEHTRNGLHGDFDRGYFSAWSDCMRVLARLNVPAPTNNVKKQGSKEQIETTRSDKSQATIENFVKDKK